ncbi:DNA polymerase III subunit beta [Tumidithrix helvetica PCC 7403]|uniref:Beta sliding clamp n=1 Tax=Tumidithrix elongata BACA0141 TaxID=2716417 RepID=A0AAW9PZR3_9CYAN|nr:DNA polymerase III subunit beta [Tumidithrix elongata RA019]
MRLVCSQSQLTANLSLVSRAVASRPTHPVLGNIRIDADHKSQMLGLIAFDLNLGIQVGFPAQVIEAGSITLPAKLLNDIVSRLPDEEVTLMVDPGKTMAMITCGSGRYQLHGLSVEEFPELPQIAEDGETAYLPVQSLIDGLNASLFATSSDETKRVLTGVHVTANADRLEFAATDGHRLSVIQTKFLDVDDVPVGSDIKTNLEVTIPARALRELERILNQQTEGAIAVRFDQSQMIFQCANQVLTSRLLDGGYPNYRQLIPTQFERQVTVERKALISALDRISVLADQKNNIVKISINATSQEIALSVEAPDLANGKESLPAQVSGDDLEIAFNTKYLMDGLKALPSNEIQIQLNSATTPVVLVPIGGVKMSYLIMPVQIRN